jgi:hypothetical protein
MGAISGCDAVGGATGTELFSVTANSAFNLWTVVQDDMALGGIVVLSNGLALTSPGANYMTWEYAEAPAVVPVPTAVWLFGSALGLLASVKRRAVI